MVTVIVVIFILSSTNSALYLSRLKTPVCAKTNVHSYCMEALGHH